MSWNMKPQEFENILKLGPNERYEYFIKKVADWQEVWGLWDEGWALYGDEQKKEWLPFWPHSRYAEVCATDDWEKYKPKMITLDDWLNKWLPGIEKDRAQIAIFPTPTGKSATVNP